MEKKLDQKKQVLISSIILLSIVLVLYGMFIVQPMLQKIINYNSEETAIKSRLQSAAVALTNKEKLAQEVEAITKKISFYEGKLPQNTDVPQVLEELVSIGQKTNVTFVSIEPQQVKKINTGTQQRQQYLAIPIEIKVKAGYHEFAKFVNEIETFQRFMKVDNVKMAVDNADAGKHDISLTVSAFALKNDGT